MFLITKYLGLELLLMSQSDQDFSEHFVLKSKKLEDCDNHVL